MKGALLAAGLALLAVSPAHARGPAAGPTPWDACFAQAGAHYGINPLLLKAIARQESSMIPSAIGNNTNGTYDIGLMQINSAHLPRLARYGLTRERLLDACTNITTGAWVLADAVRRHGMTWRAVGAYHSPTPWRQEAYAAKVAVHLMRELQAANGQIPVVPAAPAVAPAPVVAAPAAPEATTVSYAAPVAQLASPPQPVPGAVVWEPAVGGGTATGTWDAAR